MEDASKRSIKVVILPFLAHGHITPFLELAKKLSQGNFHIYFCSSPINLNSIRPKLSHHPNNYPNCIELVELHLPTTPELPPHYHTTKGLPPHLLRTLHEVFNKTRPNFLHILETLKPYLVIYDFFPSWVSDVASSLNIPCVGFVNTAASFTSCFIHRCKKKNLVDFPFPEISPDDMELKFTIMLEIASGNYEDALRFYESSCGIVLIKSLRELEGKYIDYASTLIGKKIVPMGLLIPDPAVHDHDEGMDIINWLGKKAKSSTVFVSFGSESYLSKEDMEEIAHGLELSKVNFIWVVRFPEGEKMNVEDALPGGFIERVRERGMVVENWAPQLKILNHSSIGGFVSHCGWGSLTESIKFGVPIIAIPIQFEQPWNARLVEESGFGLEVKRDNINGRLQRENVAKIIKLVVLEKPGEDIRRKAREISDNLERKGGEDMDEVVKELLQLCDPTL